MNTLYFIIAVVDCIMAVHSGLMGYWGFSILFLGCACMVSFGIKDKEDDNT